MKVLENLLQADILSAINQCYQVEIEPEKLSYQQTKKGFEGEITLVCFPFSKLLKDKPASIAENIGNKLVELSDLVKDFNVAAGFLNLSIQAKFWNDFLFEHALKAGFGFQNKSESSERLLVEYSSPNTNKPLHLGHIRNILLGFSVSNINAAAGKDVRKVQIINDRGIHICKSMLAWTWDVNRKSPSETGLKGDKLVGNYYVAFDKQYKEEVQALMEQGRPEDDAKKEAASLLAAQEMLRKWESGEPETVALWKKMNEWVYAGFNETYDRLGVNFDQNYYESETYLLGKQVVDEGLDKGVFFRKEDGSVWCDLSDEGLDEKIVLRADGTAVYMTQDIGTAIQRFKDFNADKQVYTVGNEQDYHFQVLFKILDKLGYSWASKCYHLSYGMVDLPSGKMKSREGTVVDADDLLLDMQNSAKAISEELGKLEGFSDEEKANLHRMIGDGALKYFILKVDPKKRILFDPEESVDFNGNTGPFIQYTHARICSILRKGESTGIPMEHAPEEKEIAVVQQLSLYPEIIQQSAAEYSPALLANYLYDLVKIYNHFYQHVPIWTDENNHAIAFRLKLSKATANTIKSGMDLLGIQVPEQM